MSGSMIAAYMPMAREPGGPGLLPALAAAGYRVLLPVLLPDKDLDWAEADGPRLGPDAITEVSAAVVPAVAVDRRGIRLGRGGGSYDRALARIRPGIPVIALLYDGELLPAVPAEPHDRPVSAVITPTGGLTLICPTSTGRTGPDR